MTRYKKPKRFDYNLAVLGAGAAGLSSAYIAATVKAKVALIEKNRMGGDCLNTGCVPSKALIKSAKLLSYAKRAGEFGFKSGHFEFEFANVMDRVKKVISKVEPHDSVERYTKLGVDCISGAGKIVSPYSIEVNGKTITAKNIVIATGARPFVPAIPGLDKVDYLTSDNVWDLRELPKRLVVLGGGPIGSELAQTFARLGSEVTLVEMLPQILVREDREVSELITKSFTDEGIRVLTGHKASEFINEAGSNRLNCEHEGKEVTIGFDRVLVAIGRKPNITGFGLEELGVELNPQGTIKTDKYLRTNIKSIYACGDVAGPYQFTHTAGYQAWFATVNAIFTPLKKFAADYSVIPWCTFTDPEVARVGINEKEAKERNIPYETVTYGIDDLDRAIADGEERGIVKIITGQGGDKILGVTIVGDHAGDLIAEYVFAMKYRLGLNKIFNTIHIYPTLSEANKQAAGVWKKAHAPGKILGILKKIHTWRRG
jgi:dihydrolipoamide dehydrogenase